MWVDHRQYICRACGKEFTGDLLQDVAPSVLTAHWKSMYCPNCGAGYRKLSLKLDIEPPNETEPLNE